MDSMILPGTGRGTAPAGRGGGGASLRKPVTYTARKLRRQMTLPELMLWNQLRGRKLGIKVRRQHPVGPFVADFYVPDAKLIIEVDGEAHNRADRPAQDSSRDAFLSGKGLEIFRVTATDVMTNLEGVLADLAVRATSPLHHPSDGPPPHAGEEL